METKSVTTIKEHFGSIQDPRIDRQKLHLLEAVWKAKFMPTVVAKVVSSLYKSWSR